jgi:integrase
MSKPDQPSVYTLPQLRLTKVGSAAAEGRLPVEHQYSGQHVKYWREPVRPTATRWTEFRSLPIVVDAEGAPWVPACLWLLDKAQAKPLNISSLKPVAQDLAAYAAFLGRLALEWDDFSAVEKYGRPTYLYRNHLNELLNSGELKRSTASRRMSSVISFYRYLMKHPRMRFEPLNDPWVDREVGIEYRDVKGFKQVTVVTTTDVTIRTPKYQDALDESIDDGGRLRPLPMAEQQALIAALRELGNIEFTLMHVVALCTGAREMTVLTLRLRDVLAPPDQIPGWSRKVCSDSSSSPQSNAQSPGVLHKIRCGPGTGIDTKGDATNVYLCMPRELYELLHSYAVSDRAKRRRDKTERGEDPNNYLFLTQHGQPYYESKEDRNALRESSAQMRRSTLSGRPLRKFVEKSVTPLVRKNHPLFKYRFHDLRATFGMNWVDHQMRQAGTEGLGKHYLWVREQLQKLMWHRSPLTTDKYLNYREEQHQTQQAMKEWSRHLNEDLLGLLRSWK